MRIDELEHADLLRYDVADVLGSEVGNQLGDQATVALGLQLAMLLRLLDCGHHHLVPTVFRALYKRPDYLHVSVMLPEPFHNCLEHISSLASSDTTCWASGRFPGSQLFNRSFSPMTSHSRLSPHRSCYTQIQTKSCRWSSEGPRIGGSRCTPGSINMVDKTCFTFISGV